MAGLALLWFSWPFLPGYKFQIREEEGVKGFAVLLLLKEKQKLSQRHLQQKLAVFAVSLATTG